jgi:hypothetical protein
MAVDEDDRAADVGLGWPRGAQESAEMVVAAAPGVDGKRNTVVDGISFTVHPVGRFSRGVSARFLTPPALFAVHDAGVIEGGEGGAVERAAGAGTSASAARPRRSTP